MTAILPPFTGESSRCAKCGHDYARTTFRQRLDYGELFGHHLRGILVEDRDQERLCRECGRCGHHWDEATVDADKPAEEQHCASRHQLADGIEPCTLDAHHMGYHRGVTSKWTDHEAVPEEPVPGLAPR